MYLHTIKAKILRRYKRFLADVVIDGEIVTVHVPNSGSMKNLIHRGGVCYVSKTPWNKLPYRMEMMQVGRTLVGVNTHLTEDLVEEALHHHKIPLLKGYTIKKRQVSIAQGKSRLDFLLQKESQLCYVEVKNVTYVEDATPYVARFPDSVTKRGQKHICDLLKLQRQAKAVLLFVVNRNDCTLCSVAYDRDPLYARILSQAMKRGLEVMAMSVHLSPNSLTITNPIPFQL